MKIRDLSTRNQVLLLVIAPFALAIGMLNLVDFVPRPITPGLLFFHAVLAGILFFFSLGVCVLAFGLARLVRMFVERLHR